MATYGAPTGYGPGADWAVSTEHQHQQPPLTHPQGHPRSPSCPYSAQQSPRGPHQGSFSPGASDHVSPAFPTSGGSGGGNYTTSAVMHDPFEIPPAKRQKVEDAEKRRRPSQPAPAAGAQVPPAQRECMDTKSRLDMRGNDAPPGHGKPKARRESASIKPGPSAASTIISKPRRVRTGCLTCRNRHLKCDEAMPICMNCQKSNRKCERGVRLNFIDLRVEQPPYLLPPVDWKGKSSRSLAALSNHTTQRLGLRCQVLHWHGTGFSQYIVLTWVPQSNSRTSLARSLPNMLAAWHATPNLVSKLRHLHRRRMSTLVQGLTEGPTR